MKIHVPENYDVDAIVVGGGPAGASCATGLAARGHSVMIFDHEKFPRDKVCGDFLGPAAVREMRTMGLSDDDPLLKNKSEVIRQAAVFLDGHQKIVKDIPHVKELPEYGVVIPRMQLDQWIISNAVRQGATLHEATRITDFEVHANGVSVRAKQKDGEKKYFCKILIAADGSNSTIARKIHGAKPNPADRILAVRAYFENVNCTPHQAQIYFTSKSFPGYYWFFPTSRDTANVGVGMVLENFPKEELNLKTLLEELIYSDAALRNAIGKGKAINKISGWPLSTYNPARRKVFDRVLLAGDAAGLINSLNGEGIQYALLSGRWAAETISECISENSFDQRSLSSYEKKIVDELEYDMLFANFIIQCIRNRDLNKIWMRFLDIIIARAVKDEKYAAIAGGILAGISPSSEAITLSFLRKTVSEGFTNLNNEARKTLRKGPLAASFASGAAALNLLNLLSGGIREKGQYLHWANGAFKNAQKLFLKIVREEIVRSQ